MGCAAEHRGFAKRVAGELFGDVTVHHAPISGGVISGEVVAELIDELPMLAALGPYTEQGVEIRDAGELRVKESDRIAVVAENLRRMGARGRRAAATGCASRGVRLGVCGGGDRSAWGSPDRYGVCGGGAGGGGADAYLRRRCAGISYLISSGCWRNWRRGREATALL